MTVTARETEAFASYRELQQVVCRYPGGMSKRANVEGIKIEATEQSAERQVLKKELVEL
jgi:hypothetical protein